MARPIESARGELRDQFIGDVPRKQERVFRLVREQPRFFPDVDDGSGDAFADLARALELQDAIEDAVIRAGIVDDSAMEWRKRSLRSLT